MTTRNSGNQIPSTWCEVIFFQEACEPRIFRAFRDTTFDDEIALVFTCREIVSVRNSFSEKEGDFAWNLGSKSSCSLKKSVMTLEFISARQRRDWSSFCWDSKIRVLSPRNYYSKLFLVKWTHKWKLQKGCNARTSASNAFSSTSFATSIMDIY